ncbi:hypothetical protein [Geodermatophilus nigrescens]|uniref:hypothetical protein n=1 Tax=Geodermatophilus nigrescens TaxID=1070870 RepID=UPI001114DF07|nr:hypothetical protein [Geodermatophilus nigrescens]
MADLLDEYDFQAGRGGLAGTLEGDRVFVPQQGPWTAEEIGRLAGRMVERKYDLVVDLMDLAAAKGDWVVPPVERAESPYHVRNQLSAMTKLIKRDFDGRSYWPMEWKRREDGVYVYRTLPEIAAWWQAARNEQSAGAR